MHFNAKALLVLVGFGVLLAIALSSNGSSWFRLAEAVTSVLILLGIARLLLQNTGRVKKLRWPRG
jgi:4-amino-4-deoxy-L-arabinose transferase-like glycosyltransferase